MFYRLVLVFRGSFIRFRRFCLSLYLLCYIKVVMTFICRVLNVDVSIVKYLYKYIDYLYLLVYRSISFFCYIMLGVG